ncbi:MAG: DinB family protein [Cytophagaceae bacterium]
MPYTIQDGFPYYIQMVGDKDFRSLFKSEENFNFFGAFSEEQSTYRYAFGKWNIKQILGHITDHERIMTYRALRFSRNDTTLLPGYDQNFFVDNSRFDELSWQHLLQDYKNVRAATNSFIDGLSPSQLKFKGQAWKFELTVQEFLKATIGHEMHHISVIKERYCK